MGSIGAPEILVILVVALIVFGPNRLPEAARQLGRAVAEVRKLSSGMQAELRDVLNPPVDGAPPPGPSHGVDVAPAPTDGKFRWSDLPPSQ
ncbi:MAG: sec-independent protein translocase protein TatB [Actinomycetota bacterium]|nr:sec-independent protein translocase protein TatB [Actinomycetota bacterium]